MSAEVDTESDSTDQVKKRRHRTPTCPASSFCVISPNLNRCSRILFDNPMMDCTSRWIRGQRTTSRQGSWTDSVSAEVDTESDPTDQVKKRRHRVSQAQLPLGRAILTLPTQCHQSLTHANAVCHSHKWTERREMVVGPFGSSDQKDRPALFASFHRT